MRVECPQFKKCCCCIPLRYGLLVWGYLKLLVSMLNLAVIVFLILTFISFEFDSVGLRATISILLLLWAVDISFNVVFVIGAHKKNIKLLRVYYFYIIVALVILSLMYLAFLALKLIELNHLYGSPRLTRFLFNLAFEMALAVVNLGLQSYLLLLIRSEVLKLRSTCKFQFVNNAADAECCLKIQNEGDAFA